MLRLASRSYFYQVRKKLKHGKKQHPNRSTDGPPRNEDETAAVQNEQGPEKGVCFENLTGGSNDIDNDDDYVDCSEETDPEFHQDPMVPTEEDDGNQFQQDPMLPSTEEDDGNLPVYTGASLSLGNSMLAILLYAMTNSLTGVAIVHLLELINLHCLQNGNIFNKTIHLFRKFFSKFESPVIFHKYCGVCYADIKDNKICTICQASTNKPAYFVEIPVIYQLARLFKREGFYDSLQHRFTRVKKNNSNIEDIYDGSVYQKYFSNPNGYLRNRDNISFTWYTDGVPVFKSSKVSIWPLYFAVNELPYKKRVSRNNIIIAGLWFGTVKPVINKFFSPYHSMLENLAEGVEFEIPSGAKIKVKAMVMCITSDLPAKAMIMNMMQFNGYYGCGYCLQKGEMYDNGGAKSTKTHVYPFQIDNIDGPKRTHGETIQHAIMAHQSSNPVFGIKSPSIISNLIPDVIECIAIDIMHSCYLGIAKKLMNLWFTSPFRKRPFSLWKYVSEVDQCLSKISPPAYIQRIPRTISKHVKYWKAAELKNWLLYYSIPILTGIMPTAYLHHHMLLVAGLCYLCQESISFEDLSKAKVALWLYVYKFQTLYGKKFMSANVHSLLHLPAAVTALGPLWVTSCFPFEDMNGALMKLIHGTRYIDKQIYAAVGMLLNIPILLQQLAVNTPVAKYCLNLVNSNKYVTRENIGKGIFRLGLYVKIEIIPPMINVALGNRLGSAIGKVNIFHRIILNGVLVCSTSYTKMVRKNSTCVKFTTDNGLCSFGFVQCFVKHIPDCICDITEDCTCTISYFAIIKECEVVQPFSVQCTNVIVGIPSMNLIVSENDYSAVKLESITCVCFTFSILDTGNKYILEPVNSVEWE